MRKVMAGIVVVFAGSASAEPLVIAALGDSLTQGYGLPAEDGFVPQLQAWLDDNAADVQLVNAGVSGDTTAGGLSRVDWTLTPDVDGVMVAFGGNDYLRGLDPAMSRGNLDQILTKLRAADVPAMLIGLQAGANYGVEYAFEFNGMYDALAQSYALPLYGDWFRALRSVDLQSHLQNDGIHPNAEGVKLIVADMGPAILDFVNSLQAD